MTMDLRPAPLPGMWVVHTQARCDERGSFARVFCAADCARIRPDLRFVQVNHSVTARRGTVRGLHLQRAPHAEAKLIRCLRGRVYDVAVDLRPHSPTYGRWHAVELSEHNGVQVFIPEGCAHGFQALDDDAHLLYQHTAPHAPGSEAGVRHDDRDLAIAWPLPAALLSPRDAALPSLAEWTRQCQEGALS
ncbi:dTDP-4-dehydrorhamnose 3,5-epimerase [Caldimonas brevitalea]|uniref:dTDP-4-dehydrorhamnose 3,5-epimerase n=1 Tax=Caldimonas brevitalea TaxID=413882 RepID=A0A0G3BWT0_9BURK|nr:dTDP-4-dehydrorhamnose 3,5-epimerase [Caldimonas brevitalea]AKJ31000.1 dTDP-4-dehydrorhamnose 3,5-epimerase [Caldimonas brevitalea]